MEFKRINENTVSCIITQEDMDEQGIVLQDLLEKKKEAMDFLHEVVERAEEEVDYKPSGEITPMQIAILQDQSICITLSENPEAAITEILKMISSKLDKPLPDGFLEELGEMPDDSERLKKLKSFVDSNRPDSIATEYGKKQNVGKSDTGINGQMVLDKIKTEGFVFTFDSMKHVIEFSRHCPSPVRIKSILFRSNTNIRDANTGAVHQGVYYLRIQRGRESMDKFTKIFTLAYEFGHFHSITEASLKYIEENFDCIIADKAVNRLKRL